MENRIQIDAICTATQEVFITMLSDQVVPGEAYSERNASTNSEGVVALIGMTGAWIGTGILMCPATLACKLSALLLMGEHPGTAVTEEVLDSVAEITNMIIGNVKNLLEEHIGELNLSIPTVVYGRNLKTRSVNDGEWVIVPFECEGERLEVRLCLVPNTGKHSARPGFGLSHVVAPVVQ
ncbi:MAG TPA: chemotaxis protein CheX [Bryobacteraceae bacterium]|nr:chemotaxis protein CheX [Bryobacteraceae bacterium]